MKNQICGLDLALLNLMKLDFVQLQDARTRTYMFTHDIICSVTYGLILPSEQQYMHKRVAMCVEERERDDLRPFFATLMHRACPTLLP